MHIRPFQLPHDLDVMTSLVAQGFEYPENPEWSIRADDKEGLLDSARGAKRMWPLLRVLRIFSPLLRDLMCGFIAEEDGIPVGLINYARQYKEPEWYVANVAVLPAYRRRGIARTLARSVLDDLRARQARRAILDVVDQNLPAVRLYQDMGFEIFDGSVELDLEAGAAVSAPTAPDGWTMSACSRFDWRTRFDLVRRILPERVARYQPAVEARFRMPPFQVLIGTLFNRMGGNDIARFALRAASGEIVAHVRTWFRAKKGGVNGIEIDLDPAHPELARFVVAHAIATVQSVSPGRRIELSFVIWQPALVEAAQSLGCKKRLGAHSMGINLS
jgi:ribosomal protein S18 acetylase RimI-like enzyme